LKALSTPAASAEQACSRRKMLEEHFYSTVYPVDYATASQSLQPALRRPPVRIPPDYLHNLQDTYVSSSCMNEESRGKDPTDGQQAIAEQQRHTVEVHIGSIDQVPLLALGLDEATVALERLVEETHQSLVREGLMNSAPPVSASSQGYGIPSLDSVDLALEELQRGLVEIDNALARPVLATGGACDSEELSRK